MGGLSERRMTGWARSMFVAVWVITVDLSILVLIFPGFGLFTLYMYHCCCDDSKRRVMHCLMVNRRNIQTNQFRSQ